MIPSTALKRALAAAAAVVVLVAFSLPRSERRALGDEPAVDRAAPRGIIAYFAGGKCPAGWVPAEEVEGRLVVGATSAGVGAKVGAPLGDREDRTHSHALTAEVKLSPKDIVAIDGSNNDGAAARAYPVAGSASAQTSGLSFVQVQACARP